MWWLYQYRLHTKIYGCNLPVINVAASVIKMNSPLWDFNLITVWQIARKQYYCYKNKWNETTGLIHYIHSYYIFIEKKIQDSK